MLNKSMSPWLCNCYHRFCPVVSGFCMFVLSLVKKHYRLQFYMVSGLKDSGLLMKLEGQAPWKCCPIVSTFAQTRWLKCFTPLSEWLAVDFLPPQFGWTHVTLLIVVTQSHLIIHNLFEGMIWWVSKHLLACPADIPKLCLNILIRIGSKCQCDFPIGSSFRFPVWSVTTSWPTCSGSSLAALLSSRSVLSRRISAKLL